MLLRNKKNGFIYSNTPALANNPDYEVFVERPNTEPSRGIHFRVAVGGIGDEICALYAACGLADAGYEVFLHTKRRRWLDVAAHKGVQLVEGQKLVVDARGNHERELSDGFAGKLKSRSHLYVENICNEYGIPSCSPSRPTVVSVPKRTVSGDYVVIAPLSSKSARDWPLQNWRQLTERMGKRTIVVGAGNQEEALRNGFAGLEVEYLLGSHPHEVLGLLAHASAVIGNDSGIVHAAGLVGSPGYAICAQFPPDYLFDCAPTVKGVMAQKDCAGCFSAEKSKYAPECKSSCSALQEVSVDRVYETIFGTPVKTIKRRKTK